MNTLRAIQSFIYEQAQLRSQEPVSNLMRFLNDSTVLEAAWKQVSRSGGKKTPGEDGMTVSNVVTHEGGPQQFLHELASQIQSGRYQPGAVRQFEMRKRNDPTKKRKLAILNLKDRVVHTAIKLILEPVVEYHLGKRAFGFRPGRSRYDELLAIQRQVQNNPDRFRVALTTDIATCFDLVDHRVVKKELGKLVNDTKLMQLIKTVLGQVSIANKGWLHKCPLGILQGSALSPMLANISLLPFDSAWARLHGNDHPLFRYADDIAVLAASKRSARKLQRDVASLLWQASRMKLSREKTMLQTFEKGVSLLGMQIQRHREPYGKQDLTSLMIDGSSIRDIFTQIDNWGEELTKTTQVADAIKNLNRKLRGWFESYQFAYDAPQAFAAIDYHVFRVVRFCLKKNLDCTSSILNAEHHFYLPSGHETWQFDAETILVLSIQTRRQYRSDPEPLPWKSTQNAKGTSHSDPSMLLPPIRETCSQKKVQRIPIERLAPSSNGHV